MVSSSVDTVAKEIISKMGSVLGVRVYLGIADGLGNEIYLDKEMGEFKDFILNFIKNNFKYLKIGEHSLPISGKNIMFFRYPKTVLVLYSVKGRVGQLLSFKSLMPKYQNIIDEMVEEREFEPMPTELQIEETLPESEAIPTFPVEIIEKAIFSSTNNYYNDIYPVVSKKFKQTAKFSLIHSVILNYSNGENSFLNIFDKLNISEEDYFKEVYGLYKANKIKIPDYELYQFNCPNCKSISYKFVPIELLNNSPNKYIRFQITPPSCDHAFYVIIDKKGKIKTYSIPKIGEISGQIDFSDLFIENLIEFLGQDNFFNIFHAVFFRYPVIFLESMNNAEKICNFLKNFFQQVTYGKDIKSLLRAEYLRTSKKYADCLVIDLLSNITANEPYESENLDFELRLFLKVLKEKDTKIQILKTYSEFERLILLIDTILNEIEVFTEIRENELIELMKTKHNIILERSEIPIIKELADIYYSVDIRKKIIQNLVGKVSDFFDGM